MSAACDNGRMDDQQREDDGGYHGELYGANARFEWFWWAVTWLTVPLLAIYLVYRAVT
jgi:hypothetical protein